nr:polysaccharide biosynthesis C-terminal domain-containing protein [Algoriphagus sp. AK58]
MIYGLSGILTKFISVFLTPIYTRVYSPEDYGVIGILTNAYFLVSIILVFALDNSTARWFYDSSDFSERKKIINTWLWSYLVFSIVACLFFFFSADFWANLLLKEYSNGIYLIKLLALTLPLLVWPSVGVNVLRFERKAKKAIFLSLFQSFMLILLNVVFVVILKFGVEGVYYAQLFGTLIILPLVFYLLKDWLGFPNLFEFKLFKSMVKYSFPFVPASLGFWIVNLSGVFFINEYLDKIDVGLFQIGVSVAAVTGLATNAFQQAWSPFAFSILNQPNNKEIYAASFQLFVLIVGSACMAVSIFSSEILIILTTPQYFKAKIVASILTFNYLFMGITSIASLGSAIAKTTTPLGFISVLSSIVLIGLNFLLIPYLGKEGAALSICISQLIIPVYMFWKSQKLYYIPFDFSKNFIMIILFILGSFSIYLFPEFGLVFTIFLKLILISIFFFILLFINRNEVRKILTVFKIKNNII